MLKAAIKRSSGEDQVRHRIIPAETIQTYVEKLAGLNGEIAEILKEEKEEKHVCFFSCLPSPVLKFLSFTAEKSRDGTEKGPKHDRARSRNLFEACTYVVPERERKREGGRFVCFFFCQ